MAGPTGASISPTPKAVRPAATTRRTAPAPSAAAAPSATATLSAAPAAAAPAAHAATHEPRADATETGPAAARGPAAALVPGGPREVQALFYGALVVLAGFVAILIGLALVLANIRTGSDATAILGVITTAIAGLGGAFFGITVGQQGTASANRDRATAEAGKDAANARTLKFAANMDPAVARRLVD